MTQPHSPGLPPGSGQLTAAQQRAVAVALRRTLDVADAVARHIERPDEPGQWQTDLTATERAALSQQVTALGAAARAAASALEVSLLARDVRAAVRSELTILWSDLEEMTPAHLRGYGRLDPLAAARLAHALAPLSAEVNALLAAVDRGRDGHA